jgi:NAD(P)-dependent dehydrogenase (short-subunit alcohol dehydrogenase family)
MSRSRRHRPASHAPRHRRGSYAARRRIESVTPAGRLLTPGEIANLLVFMASPLASALGGAAVVADGALTATYDFRLDG